MTITTNFAESPGSTTETYFVVTNATVGSSALKKTSFDFYFGIAIACTAAFLVGASFVVTKIALLKSAKKRRRAVDGGYGYLKEPIWWLGMLINGIGECLNFTAYGFAPASIVSPLNGLGVLVSAVGSAKFLDERLNLLGKIGCALAIVGATGIIIHAPRTSGPANLNIMSSYVNSPAFLSYFILVFVTVVFLILYLAPKYGRKIIFIYIGACSLIGSFLVLIAKTIGLIIRESIDGNTVIWKNYISYASFIFLVFCVVLQIKYFNMALDAFNTPVVICIYHTMFTSTVILSNIVLMQEFASLSLKDIIGLVCGLIAEICGIFQLNAFKNLSVSLSDISLKKEEIDKELEDEDFDDCIAKRENV